MNQWPARIIIDHLHKSQFTGQLSLSHKEKRKKIWFFQGEIFRVQSNLLSELMGHLMVVKGWLNEAELETYLKLQDEDSFSAPLKRKIGELVIEQRDRDPEELETLHEFQKIVSLVQALTWDDGDYAFTPLDLREVNDRSIPYEELVHSIQGLFEIVPVPLGPLFQRIAAWKPNTGSVDLNGTPLWILIAGCRASHMSGILSVRRQHKLFEIVFKYGVPLTLYEGTFSQPRQTVVVRQTSDEHERFFINQLFRLFSLMSGTAHFRMISEKNSESSSSHRRNKTDWKVHEMNRNPHQQSHLSDAKPLELGPEYLVETPQKNWSKFFNGFLEKFKVSRR